MPCPVLRKNDPDLTIFQPVRRALAARRFHFSGSGELELLAQFATQSINSSPLKFDTASVVPQLNERGTNAAINISKLRPIRFLGAACKGGSSRAAGAVGKRAGATLGHQSQDAATLAL